MDYTVTTTSAKFATDIAAADWPADVVAAVAAAKPLCDLSKAAAVEVSVAVGDGGWCVVRIAPFNPEQ